MVTETAAVRRRRIRRSVATDDFIGLLHGRSIGDAEGPGSLLEGDPEALGALLARLDT